MVMFGVASVMNYIGFVVKLKDESRLEEAKKLAWEGFSMWNNPIEYPKYECCGYAEPAMELLDEAGIEYEIDEYYEEEDDFGDADVKKEYEDIEVIC